MHCEGDCLLTVYQAKNVIFRNPNTAQGETEPTVRVKDEYVCPRILRQVRILDREQQNANLDIHSGSKDMSIDGVWARRGVTVGSEAEYHL